MKTLFKYIILFSLTFVISSCSGAAENTSEEFGNAEERVYEVFGMGCPGCHGGLEKLLDNHDDVIGSKADWVNKRVSLYLAKNSTITEEEILELIKNANFTPGKRIK